MRLREAVRLWHRGLERAEHAQKVSVRLNLLEEQCHLVYRGDPDYPNLPRELKMRRGVWPCWACGSWESCEPDCHMAPWNLEPKAAVTEDVD